MQRRKSVTRNVLFSHSQVKVKKLRTTQNISRRHSAGKSLVSSGFDALSFRTVGFRHPRLIVRASFCTRGRGFSASGRSRVLPALVGVDPGEEEGHGDDDEGVDLELVGEKEGGDDGRDHVGEVPAVLLDDVIQVLQNGGCHQTPEAAHQESRKEEEVDCGAHGWNHINEK